MTQFRKKSLGILLVIVMSLSLLMVMAKTFGYHFLVVLSGSMAPSYSVGSLLITRPVTFDGLKVGDVVSYQSTTSQQTVVTHRIIGLDSERQELTTQGDANQYPDGQVVNMQQLMGTVKLGIPQIGYLIIFLQGKANRFLLLMLLLIVIGNQIWLQLIRPNSKKLSIDQ